MAKAHHVASSLLGHEPGALEVGVDHPIPVLLALLEDGLGHRHAGVVDQNADGPQLLIRPFHEPDHALVVQDIELHGHCTAVKRFDFLAESRQGLEAPGADRESRPGLGEGEGKMAS